MKSQNKAIILLFMTMIAAKRAHAQTSEIVSLVRDFEAKAAAGTPRSPEEAEPAFERFAHASRDGVTEALPIFLEASSSPYVSVRRLSAMGLFAITTRPDGRVLLPGETGLVTALLVDLDVPIRRTAGMSVAALRPDSGSPLVPALQTFLTRDDAVSTIGAGVAIVLMQAAPNDAETTNAVVRYMERKDQNSASRDDLLNGISHIARSRSREIGKVVATYADDPSEQTSALAIETLHAMGGNVLRDNQQSLSRIAADSRRAPSVRAAATKALSSNP